MEMDPSDTAFIWGDRNALMRDSKLAPRAFKGPASENNYREMVRWGRAFTDLIALSEPCLTTLFGGEFRLDHFYLNLLRKGNRVTSRNLHGSPHGAGTYCFYNGRPHCTGLVTVAIELMPVRPGDGGFACIEGSHKQNSSLPRAFAVLEPPHDTPETHPFARAVQVEAGSAIVFTEVRVGQKCGCRAVIAVVVAFATDADKPRPLCVSQGVDAWHVAVEWVKRTPHGFSQVLPSLRGVYL